ncbi:MAG: phosphatase [Bacillota bacterium]
MNDYLFQPQIDTHTHTIISGHSWSTLQENVSAAKQKKLCGICLTEHGPAIQGGAPEFIPHSQQMLPKKIDGITIYKGIEANIIDYNGKTDIPDQYLQLTEFAIASFHIETLKPAEYSKNTQAYIGAIQNPYIDMLGHADDPRIPCDFEAIILEAKRLHKLLELNNNSLTPHRPNSRESITTFAKLCKKHEMPVCISSDAHFHTMIGNVVPLMKLLYELDFPQELIMNRTQQTFEHYLNLRSIRLKSKE